MILEFPRRIIASLGVSAVGMGFGLSPLVGQVSEFANLGVGVAAIVALVYAIREFVKFTGTSIRPISTALNANTRTLDRLARSQDENTQRLRVIAETQRQTAQLLADLAERVDRPAARRKRR